VYTPTTTEVRRIEVGFRSKGELWSEARRSDMLTGDQNILKIMMAVQYKIKDPDKFLFATSEPEWLIERAVESAMSSYIASISVDDVLTTAKAEVEIRSVEEAQKLLDDYYAGVTLLTGNLQVVSPPAPVIEAFNDVARAKKDSERAVEDSRVYANAVIPQARGDAQIVINKALGAYEMRVNKAHGEAKRFNGLLREYVRDKEVTRKRLYLETMERILARTKVVIVDDSSKVTIIEE
jgi:membrane protease subunit HflK